MTRAVARAALEVYEVDDSGLDRLDRAVLSALVRGFGGGPVGLSTLAVAVGEEAETVEVVVEPFLVRAGLIARTPRGRWRPRPPGRSSGCPSPGRLTPVRGPALKRFSADERGNPGAGAGLRGG